MATINGSVFNEVIRGTQQNDLIDGLAGDDYLFGDSGDDTLLGADGNDMLDGWNGNDILAGGDGDDWLIGQSGDDVLDGGNGNDYIYGEADNDYIFGSNGFDAMNGGTGFDTVDYSLLNKAITLEAAGVVDKGNAEFDQVFAVEKIVGAAGFANTIDGSTGDSSDVFFSVDLSTSNLTVNGIPGLGSQTFVVENFVNVVGTTQNDTIGGNSADNFLVGGAGDDILFGADGNDLIAGDFGNDIIGGGNGNDVVLGGIGNDFIDGGTGSDTMDYSQLDSAISLEATGVVNKGTAGVDQVVDVETIIGNASFFNTIDASTGDSTTVSLDVDLAINNLTVNGIPGLGSQIFTVENFIDVVGTTQDDSISGDSLDNILDGNAGNDIVFGADGDDLIFGNLGDDALGGGSGNDEVFGGSGNDLMIGSTGNDLMEGGTGSDIVDYGLVDSGITLEATGIINKGSAGVDQMFNVETIIGNADFINTIDGSTGDSTSVFFDINLSAESLVVNNIPGLGSLSFTVENFADVIGTSQADTIVGNSASNFLNGLSGNDFIAAGSGNDVVDGGAGNDEVFGESGNDILRGFTGDDILVGGTGTDELFGESGNDALFGYGGTIDEYDVLVGGSGADAFFLGDTTGVYYLDFGFATITDFNRNAGDSIVLAGGSSAYSLGTQDFSGGSALDTLIFFNDDLIGVLEDTTNVNSATDFFYV